MNAKKMFEQLEFKIIPSGSWCITYAWNGESDKSTFVFWLLDKSVDVPFGNTLELSHFKAIHQQMIELGWIE